MLIRMRKCRIAFVLVVLVAAVLMAGLAYADGYPYDVNGDGRCDDADFDMVTELFGVSNPNPRYDPKCDVNGDREIDIKDLALMAKASAGGGFFVVPEYWLGTILGLAGFFAAFGVFRLRKGRLL